jgi:hypothetical protein
MPLRQLVPLLALLLVASVAAMVYGAGADDRMLTAVAAGLYATAVVAAGLWINLVTESDTRKGPGLMRRNARLAALVYAWGGAAMLAVYSIGGLKWRHWWQYGLAMALVAVLLMAYAHRAGKISQPRMPPLALTALHGAAAAGGLVYLLAAGKLATTKEDWAANDIFLFGGLAIVALCLIAGVKQSRRSRTPV